jgi:shikimate dehydrogenase
MLRLPTRLANAILCAVVGTPIAHSRSPLIHRLFAEQFGIALQYERIEVPPGGLSEVLQQLQTVGCRGVNVTVPLKAEAMACAVARTAGVDLTGAANTLWWTETQQLAADNTDGAGLIVDLTHHWGIDLEGKDVLLLGAGGAAAGIIPSLLAAKPGLLRVLNRDSRRAAALVQRFKTLGPICELAQGASLTEPVNVLINATSAGVADQVPDFPGGAVTALTRCYDLYYASGETPFLAHVRRLGANYCRDGLGMLVEQAAVSFERWHGVRPDTAPVLASLRPRQVAIGAR